VNDERDKNSLIKSIVFPPECNIDMPKFQNPALEVAEKLAVAIL